MHRRWVIINENDDQRGLAHLLEHLAFNGSEHFQGNSLQNYLQSIGVEYGKNLNAYTSIDKTVYYFTDVPTTRATAVRFIMLILKDWSNGISLTKEAIDGGAVMSYTMSTSMSTGRSAAYLGAFSPCSLSWAASSWLSYANRYDQYH